MEPKLSFNYIGGELELFSNAKNWSKYIYDVLLPYIHGNVIEVGSGLGTRTLQLSHLSKNWIALEPDESLCRISRTLLTPADNFKNVEIYCSTLSEHQQNINPDVILYIDVLEHINDDISELKIAADLLKKGGKIIVLAPAHQFLYTDFDKAIGHYRRYNGMMLKNITPRAMKLTNLKMLDSAGLLASLGNKFILNSATPSLHQIKLWDSLLVRISRFIDVATDHKIGKTILAVYTKL